MISDNRLSIVKFQIIDAKKKIKKPGKNFSNYLSRKLKKLERNEI